MKSNKHMAQQIAFTVFRLAVYGFVTVVALYITFITPAHIKKALNESNAYARFAPLTIEQSAKLNQGSSAPLNDPRVQQIIIKSFPATKLKLETEKVLDSAYLWLSGQTTKPQYAVDFSKNIDQMAIDLSMYGMQRLGELPTCEYVPQTVDPFTAACRPKYYDYSAEQLSLQAAIKENNGIMQQTVFTADDLPKTGTTPFIEQYSYAPTVYKLLQYSPYLLFLTVMLSGFFVVLYSRKKRDGVRLLGRSTVGATIFLVLSPLVYFYILPRFIPSLRMESSNDGGSAVIADVVNRVTVDFSNQLIIVGFLVLSVGLMMLILERATRPASRYVRVDQKSGIATSESPPKQKRTKSKLAINTVPIQTSEGRRNINQYNKSKKYRTIPKKEFE